MSLARLPETRPPDWTTGAAGLGVLLSFRSPSRLSTGLRFPFQLEHRLISQADRELARQVAVELGFLPLALTQAGSYISERQISFQKYMSLLNGDFRTVTSAKSGTYARRAIFTTWEISFAALSHSAQELLLLCGFLANSDIPDAVFIQESKLPFEWVREGKKCPSDLASCQLTCVDRRYVAYGRAC
jgi:hypothetical protein